MQHWLIFSVLWAGQYFCMCLVPCLIKAGGMGDGVGRGPRESRGPESLTEQCHG